MQKNMYPVLYKAKRIFSETSCKKKRFFCQKKLLFAYIRYILYIRKVSVFIFQIPTFIINT